MSPKVGANTEILDVFLCSLPDRCEKLVTVRVFLLLEIMGFPSFLVLLTVQMGKGGCKGENTSNSGK